VASTGRSGRPKFAQSGQKTRDKISKSTRIG
jgi:hypothetical protein